ncbi:MAG TPA: extensin family protein [Kofleriaceae bacterium]
MRNLCFLAVAVVGWSGCSVDVEVASLSFVSPAPGSSHLRDQLGVSGSLVAPVGVEVEVGGDIARVALTARPTGAADGDVALGDLVDGQLSAELAQSGALTLTATAFADDGSELLSTAVDITVDDPVVGDCHGWLDLYHLDYTTGPANLGIADPVTVKLPLNGVAFRYSGNAEQRKTLYGDCLLMKSLAQAAPIVRSHDVQEIVDIGIYNYRCIDQSLTPPNCSMSQHAYAKAIDIAELVTSDLTHYSVLKDWVIDSTATCTAETTGDKDAFLHEVICELKAADVWNIVLTPNYNADHRNHFHVDLTKDSDFIKRANEALPLDD